MNRMTVYDQTRLCFKVTPHQEPGRSVIQELGIYEDIHEEEIKKARNITDIRDLYFTKGAKLDPYWENLGKPKTERNGLIPVSVLDKIKAKLIEEKECAYADFERYKVEYLGQDRDDVCDSLPQDDFRYGLERCIDIINKYMAESEVEG